MPKKSPAKSNTSKKTAKKAAAKPAAKATKKKTAKKKASSKQAATSKTKKKADNLGDEVATIDRRRKEQRAKTESPAASAEPAAKLERRKKVNRRRQIDPTTCERDYSDAEVEFMNALDDYKRTSGRMFPTCSEVLEVIRGLGYVQISAGQMAAKQPASDEDLEAAAEREAAAAQQLSAELGADPEVHEDESGEQALFVDEFAKSES